MAGGQREGPFQELIHLNDQPVGPIALYARNSGGETQYSKGVENKGHSDSRDASHGSVSYDTEDSEPFRP